jgi:SulP family sulfate permease
MLVVLLLTVFWDLVYAVGIGLVIASLIFMKKMGDSNSVKSGIKRLSDTKHMDHADYSRIPVKLREEIFIKELSGPIFFGYTSDFQSMSRDIPPYATHAIIRMKKVPFIDQSGLFAFEDVLQNMVQKGIQPLLIEVQEQPLYRLETIDIIPDLVGKEHVFESYDACLQWIVANVEDTVPALEN